MGCAVDVRGQAPGSREHALLAPGRLVERVHGVLLTGGSAFGLDAGTGIMGRKNGHQSDYLTIFVFDLDETLAGQSVAFASESTKLARLAELGFNVISHQHCDTPDEAIAYFRRIAAERDTLPIWIDGVVMKVDDIAHQRALHAVGPVGGVDDHARVEPNPGDGGLRLSGSWLALRGSARGQDGDGRQGCAPSLRRHVRLPAA